VNEIKPIVGRLEARKPTNDPILFYTEGDAFRPRVPKTHKKMMTIERADKRRPVS